MTTQKDGLTDVAEVLQGTTGNQSNSSNNSQNQQSNTSSISTEINVIGQNGNTITLGNESKVSKKG